MLFVNNANEELDGMAKIDLSRQAVADKKFEAQLSQSVQQDSMAVVTMTKYAPNHLEYEAESSKGGVIVFSEIYYPGWTCTVDGREVELGRVNYVLRAVNVKAGKHKIVLDFHPQTVKATETVAYTAFGILVLCLLVIIALYFKRRK